MATTYPLVNLLHLRSVTQNQVPVNLEAGQIAFNLYDALNTATSNYGVELFIGTGGSSRVDSNGTDLAASALITSASTGEVITAGKGWTKMILSDDFTPDNPSNLFNIVPAVVNKSTAIKELDKLLGLLPSLTTTAKTDLVSSINELNQAITQLTAGSQYVGEFSPASDAISSVSASGVREGYTTGALPAPIDSTERHYFIVADAGALSGSGNVPTGTAKVGDWIISDGVTWKLYNYINDDGASVQVAAVAPTTQATGTPLADGDLWFDTANLELNVWYDDGTTQQWRPAGSTRDPIIPANVAPATPTTSWPLWLNTAGTDALGNTGKLNFWSGTGWEEIVSTVTDGGVF